MAYKENTIIDRIGGSSVNALTAVHSHKKENVTACGPPQAERLLQNGKFYQDIIYCSQTESYILYDKLILRQPLFDFTGKTLLREYTHFLIARRCYSGRILRKTAETASLIPQRRISRWLRGRSSTPLSRARDSSFSCTAYSSATWVDEVSFGVKPLLYK